MSDVIKVGAPIRFWARWSAEERFGTVTRVGFHTVWVGAYCYHHDDLRRVREWRT